MTFPHLQKLFCPFSFVMEMARNEISLLLSLFKTIYAPFNDILHDINIVTTKFHENLWYFAWQTTSNTMLFSIHGINNSINRIIIAIKESNDTKLLWYMLGGSLVIVQMKSFEFFWLGKSKSISGIVFLNCCLYWYLSDAKTFWLI